MFRTLNPFLLLFCFIIYSGYSESPVEGNSLIGKKGGNVTLSCGSEHRDITVVELSNLLENIFACEKEECKSVNDRVCKEGSCDVIINGLIYSDAGKYFLDVLYTNDQRELERQMTEYHLHIHDEISVKKGEDLKLDVLLTNADKVERNSSGEWTELWRRGHGVSSDDRLTVSEQTLIIHEFTHTDTGTYRVLDSNNEDLITIRVTDWKRDLNNTKLQNFWMLPVGLTVVLMGLLVLMLPVVLITVVIYRRWHRDYLNGESTEFRDQRTACV